MSYLYWTLLAFVIWYLSHQAGRLDRLHHRIDITEAALDSHLGRRAGIVAEIASIQGLDPVTSAVLAQISHDVLATEPHELIDRLQLENELSDLLIATFDNQEEVAEWSNDNIAKELLQELRTVCGRVNMSHSFHTEAVVDCRNLRRQLIVRLFRLAGFARMPAELNLVSQIPPGLSD